MLTPEEIDELLNIRDMPAGSVTRPFLSTLPGVVLLIAGVLVVVALIAGGILSFAWRRGLGGLAPYQQPYAQLIRLGRWSGTLGSRVSDTPLELADRLGRHVPRAQAAISDVADVYVEGTYSNRTPARNPWPAWLAARRDVIRGLVGRRLGGWLGEDAPLEQPPRSHPELLRTWGGRRRQEEPRQD
jgi:hypothetical protein